VSALLLGWRLLDGAGFVPLALFGFSLSPIFALMITRTQEQLGPVHAPNAIGLQVAAAAAGVGVLPGLAGVLADRWGLEVIPAFLLAVICLYLYSGPFTAVSQNVVSPGLRASSVTLLLFVSHVFGDSHSTFDVGVISERIGSLQTALLITSPTLLILAAAIAATGLRTVQRDTQAMEEEWAARPAEPEEPALLSR